MSQLWHWRAKLDPYRSTRYNGVVDGDTYSLVVDCGFYTSRRIRVRAKGIDTHEIHGVSHDSEEYELGMAQKEFVEEWFLKAEAESESRWPVLVQTEQAQGKYGRWLADIERRSDGSILREEIVGRWPAAELE